ncbi:MAG TPA: lysylphosphatidylglycerol synthase transmembrane domain-containing protein [Nevskiaceae bacterium]|nr:lysylphosphatidylglycerol synthase transmembrane domain-containing protein [Nevskiaceae bacterium]
MAKASAHLSQPHIRRQLFTLAVLLLALYVFVPQIKGLSASTAAFKNVQPAYVIVGLALTAATYGVAAGLYQLLAKRQLRYGRTLLVQTSSAFVNRLLPAGVGGISLSVAYLRSARHSVGQAAAVVSANNTLGLVGHTLLMAGVVATSDASFNQVTFPRHATIIFAAIVTAGVAVGLIVFRRARRVFVRTGSEVLRNLAGYRHHPWRLLLALLGSMLLTALYAGVLWACARAVHCDLPLVSIFVVFTAGAFLGTATPTPGGVVGAEAGLLGGFVAYGVDAGTGLAIALLYRFLTYWLPLAPGFVAFIFVRRRLRFFT